MTRSKILGIVAGLSVAAIAIPMSSTFAQDAHKPDAHAGHDHQSDKDIIETATGPGMTEVTTLVKAVQAAGLVETLKGTGPFTVFAPTNAAFAKLPAGTLEDLLKPENKEKLKAILLYHVHPGQAIESKDVKTMDLTTADGDKKLKVVAKDGKVTVNGANVIKTDVHAKNGVIHWVDTVLLPAATEH